MEVFWNHKSADRDVHVRQCGSEVCVRSHQYGPAVRDHYLIHFIDSGKGTFFAEGCEYPLRENQGFIIFPGQVTTYRADEKEPWVYGWIGYEGRGAALLTETVGLSKAAPTFTLEPGTEPLALIRRITRAVSEMRLGDLAMLGGLYQLLAEVGQTFPSPQEDLDTKYYKKAMWFLEGNYQRPVLITDVAEFVGLSRSQLFRVFQRVDGISPKAFLNELRAERAAKLLRASDLSLEEIAASAGFPSAGRMNAVFRGKYGMSAGQYRKSLHSES